MSEKNTKALVIKVRPSAEPPGVEHVWDKLNIQGVVKHIVTPTIATENGTTAPIDVGAIVSGMPSVYARAVLFRNALDHVRDREMEGEGLIAFYKTLVDEWRGLIACIAWNNSDIEVRRVVLEYSDGQPLDKTANLYEPKGAFGNLLFHRKPLWYDPEKAEPRTPVIDIIRYRKKVVGACSPDSFLFTSVGYKLEGTDAFIEGGRFRDPLRGDVDAGRLGLLRAYVKHVLDGVSSRFEKHFKESLRGTPDLVPRYDNLSTNLSDWLAEIDAYAERKGHRLQEQIPEVSLFKPPFNLLLNHTTELYGLHGTISHSRGEGYVLFDPRKILLPEGSEVAMVHATGAGNFLEGRAVHLLKAAVKGGEPGDSVYFAVPLTPLGLAVFGRNIGALLGQGQEGGNVRSRLSGAYDAGADELTVTLKLVTEAGREILREQKYRTGAQAIKNRDVLLWPNFISEKWHKYFLYSELPHNETGLQATPILAWVENGVLGITPETTSDNTVKAKLRLAALGGKAQAAEDLAGANVKLHIHTSHKVADVPYKYEIYESDTPFAGFQITNAGREQGYVILRYGTSQEAPLVDLMGSNRTIDPVRLGVDFGSTNTSIAYASRNEQEPQGWRFINRRVSVFGHDLHRSGGRDMAIENELFFFQNEPVQSNSIKSVLTLHDFRRIVEEAQSSTPEAMAARPIKGGFPCFEKNLPIDRAEGNRYILDYGPAGRVELVHGMKWGQGVENSYIQAYLSALLLHVYADLFAIGKAPKEIKWSYPSAMSQTMIGQFNRIWENLSEFSSKLVDAGYGVSVSRAPLKLSGGRTQGVGSDGDDIFLSSTKPAASETREESRGEDGIKFDLVAMGGSESMTEACAVANYLIRHTRVTPGNLALCFDVGGSTTDILALCMMKDPGSSEGRLAMVKQNSIRFAAQRVSQAAQYAPGLQNALMDVCRELGLSFQGLTNKGGTKFSPSTAAYYFEQLVDRLEEHQLPKLYRAIHAHCPALFSINLYVTGLITFYAGQLARKLDIEISRSPERHDDFDARKLMVNVRFAGKGARIFDWFQEVDATAAKQYREDLFRKGYGSGGALSGLAIETPLEAHVPDVKYEVSKGLARDPEALWVPGSGSALEIIGEEYFKLKSAQLSSTDTITGDMMGLLESGAEFYSAPPPGEVPCPRFAAFAGVFFKTATELFGLPMTKQDFVDGFNKLNIEAYIKSQKEFRDALTMKRIDPSSRFDYVAPIIILEGMKFLEDVILPKLAQAR